ncbi:MAG: DUF4854 domain-containing protein [Lachnospiraceae bacterium]|nr:DUF4854 domain-containing protein [Lachnospiraceae bacterium]
MKRKSLKFIACAAIMAMTLSVTACGGSDDTAPAAETEETTGTEAEPEAEADTEAEPEAEADVDTEAEAEPEEDAEAEDDSAAADGQTLEDIFNDPATKSQYEAVFEAMGQEGMEVSVETTGNELAVIIKITDSSMVVDGMGEALESALDQQAATFEAQVEQFDEAVGTPGACTVTMRYLDPDDNVLAEKSFTAQ